MKKYSVEFLGGESRMNPSCSCNFMLVKIDDEHKLYAEYAYPEGVTYEDDDYDDYAGYDQCKAEIVEQAKALGIDEDEFEF